MYFFIQTQKNNENKQENAMNSLPIDVLDIIKLYMDKKDILSYWFDIWKERVIYLHNGKWILTIEL